MLRNQRSAALLGVIVLPLTALNTVRVLNNSFRDQKRLIYKY
jgi:hypothetical protein